MKQSQKTNILFIATVIILSTVVASAIYLVEVQPKQNSIFPQSSMYHITVTDANNTPVPNAKIYLFNTETNQYDLHMGPTDNWGHAQFQGWQGISVQATYNEFSATGTLPDQPQELTLVIPTTISYNPPPTQQPVEETKHAFSVTINPAEAGVVGVDDGNGNPAQGEYVAGTELTLNAVALTNYRFVSFTVNGQTYSTSPVTITVTADTVVTANFEDTSQVTPTEEPTPNTLNYRLILAIIIIAVVIAAVIVVYWKYKK